MLLLLVVVGVLYACMHVCVHHYMCTLRVQGLKLVGFPVKLLFIP